jgi:hypothetical protein
MSVQDMTVAMSIEQEKSLQQRSKRAKTYARWD